MSTRLPAQYAMCRPLRGMSVRSEEKRNSESMCTDVRTSVYACLDVPVSTACRAPVFKGRARPTHWQRLVCAPTQGQYISTQPEVDSVRGSLCSPCTQHRAKSIKHVCALAQLPAAKRQTLTSDGSTAQAQGFDRVQLNATAANNFDPRTVNPQPQPLNPNPNPQPQSLTPPTSTFQSPTERGR